MYKMYFDDGKIKMLVAINMTYEECIEIKNEQLKPECYFIVSM